MSLSITEFSVKFERAYIVYCIYHSIYVHMRAAKLDGECYSVFRNGIKKVNEEIFFNDHVDLHIENESNLYRWVIVSDMLYQHKLTITPLEILLGLSSIMMNKGVFYPTKESAIEIIQAYDDYSSMMKNQCALFVKDLIHLSECALADNMSLNDWILSKRNVNTFPNIIWEVLAGKISDMTLYAINRIFSILSPNQLTLFKRIFQDNSIIKLIILKKFIWEDIYLLDYNSLLTLYNSANQSSIKKLSV